VVTGGFNRAGNQILDNPLMHPQAIQRTAAGRADRMSVPIRRQWNLLIAINPRRRRTQRRFVSELAARLLFAAPRHIGLHERWQPAGLRLTAAGRNGWRGLLLELFDPLLQFGNVFVFLFQLNVAHMQLVLQPANRRFQQGDRASEIVSFVTNDSHATEASKLPENARRGKSATVNCY
jgi:hypothetical protein